MAKIADEIVRANFFGYKQDGRCVVFATDNPSVKLGIRGMGESAMRTSNLGCEKRSHDPIPELSRKIDEIVDTVQWIGDSEKMWR